jgi:hypothetical protein
MLRMLDRHECVSLIGLVARAFAILNVMAVQHLITGGCCIGVALFNDTMEQKLAMTNG